MAWRLSGTPKIRKMTPQLAKDWQELESIHIDRTFNQTRLDRYKKMWDEKLFRPVEWARCFVRSTSKWVRMNGNHTSKMFTEVDLSNREQYATIQEFECDEPEDLPSLYATFDSQYQTRTRTDINHAYAALIPELKSVDAQLVNLLVTGLHLYQHPMTQGTHGSQAYRSQANKAELLFDNVPVCMWLLSIFEGIRTLKNRHFRRGPVIAAMIAAWHKAPQRATDFWLLVRDASGLDPKGPDRVLNKWLCETRCEGGGGAVRQSLPKRMIISPHQYFATCIKMWNGWRKGEFPTLRYSPSDPIPTVK